MGGEEEVVVAGGLPVAGRDVLAERLYPNTIFEEVVNFPVGVGEVEGASVAGEFFDGDRLLGEVRVEFF